MKNHKKMIAAELILREGVSGFSSEGIIEEFLLDVSGLLDLPGPGENQMEVLLTDDVEMRRLNREYRGKDRTTDVLSFPDGENLPESDDIFLGSVVISVERAAAQAKEIGHSLEEELKFLLLHGLLHLLGYDHERDGGEMLKLQQRLKAELTGHFGGNR